MGTRRLHVALLLAVLQYTAVVRGQPNCPTAFPPFCPNAHLVDNSKCKELAPGPPPTCSSDKMYIKVAASGGWQEISNLDCTATDKWTATIINPPGPHQVDPAVDLIICSAADPVPAPASAECTGTPTLKSTCPDFDTKRPFIDCLAIDPPPATALCDATHKTFYSKGATGKWEEAALTCKVEAGADVWSMTPVGGGASSAVDGAADNAVCAKFKPDSKSCANGAAAPTLTCPTDLGNNLNCAPITLKDVEPLGCTAPQEMFYELSAGAGWKKASSIKCDLATGKWDAKDESGSPFDLGTSSQLICSQFKPLSCKTENSLLDAVIGDLNGDAGPEKVLQLNEDDVSPACTTPTHEIYYDQGTGWTKAATTITCNKATGKWKAAPGVELAKDEKVVCATKDPKKVKCLGLSSACPQEAAEGSVCTEKTPLPDEGDLDSLCAGRNLFLKTQNQPWTAKTGIKCDLGAGKWMDGTTPLDAPTVVCADSDPSPLDCTSSASPPLTPAECPPNTPAATQCEKITLTDDSPLICPSKIYVRPTGGDWIEAGGNKVQCNRKKGKWEQGAGLDLTADEIICANEVPKSADVVCTQVLSNECTSDVKLANAGCDAPLDAAFEPKCDGNKNLYFKKTGVAYFQQAVSVNCEGTDWKIKYNFGDVPKTDEVLVQDDHLICANDNPDPAVCEFGPIPVTGSDRAVYTMDQAQATGKSEPGKKGKCPEKKYSFFNGNNKGFLDYDSAPVCGADGNWKEHLGESLFGSKVACALKKCRSCALPTTTAASMGNLALPYLQLREVDQPYYEECSLLTCQSGYAGKMVVKVDNEDYTYRYLYNSPVTCNVDGSWTFDDGKVATEAICSQKLYCLKDDVAQVNRKCPGDNSIQGCKDPTVSGTEDKTLECPSGTTMFIRDDLKEEKYFDEITAPSIDCDEEQGTWNVENKILNGEPGDKRRDWHHTIICAAENPQRKSTTTTTTTTEAPLRPICEVCGELLYDLFKFDSCTDCKNISTSDLTAVPLEGEPEEGDQCILRLKDKKREIIINSYEQVNTLTCYRNGRTSGKWKNGENDVDKLASRPTTKKGEWKLMSYVVIAVVFVAIGGIGIGCVVIYMKMRKQPSSREKKKKERGVTKKYVSSNVVKTNNRSVGTSREGGKSKHGSASKIEDNEDTPTLKL